LTKSYTKSHKQRDLKKIHGDTAAVFYFKLTGCSEHFRTEPLSGKNPVR